MTKVSYITTAFSAIKIKKLKFIKIYMGILTLIELQKEIKFFFT